MRRTEADGEGDAAEGSEIRDGGGDARRDRHPADDERARDRRVAEEDLADGDECGVQRPPIAAAPSGAESCASGASAPRAGARKGAGWKRPSLYDAATKRTSVTLKASVNGGHLKVGRARCPTTAGAPSRARRAPGSRREDTTARRRGRWRGRGPRAARCSRRGRARRLQVEPQQDGGGGRAEEVDDAAAHGEGPQRRGRR